MGRKFQQNFDHPCSVNFFLDKSLGDTASDVISDSSGVGTSQSDTTNSLSIPGTTVVCVESYNSGILGHLNINQGDILEGIDTPIIIFSYLYLPDNRLSDLLHSLLLHVCRIKKGKSERFLFYSNFVRISFEWERKYICSSIFDSDRGDRLRPSRGCASRTGHGSVPGALRARGQASPHQHSIGPPACEGRPEQGVGS